MPAWPALACTSLAANKAARTGRYADLVTRHLCLVEQPFTAIYAAAANKVGTVYTEFTHWRMYVPLQWVGANLSLWLRSYVSAGAPGGYFRVVIQGGNNGTEIAVSNTTPYAINGPSVVVLPATVGGVIASIEYKATTGNTIYVIATTDALCVVER
jgi:hypothetical protein